MLLSCCSGKCVQSVARCSSCTSSYASGPFTAATNLLNFIDTFRFRFKENLIFYAKKSAAYHNCGFHSLKEFTALPRLAFPQIQLKQVFRVIFRKHVRYYRTMHV
jgi:hypothetical protein